MKLSKRGQLILNLSVPVVGAAILWTAYTDPGQPHAPLATSVQIWAIMAAALVGGYFWQRKKKQQGRPQWLSARQGLEVLGYFLLSAGAAATAKLWFSPTVGHVYLSVYWTAAGLTALAMLYLFTAQRYFNQRDKKAELGLMALVTLAGIASAPIAALYQANFAGGAPFPIAVVMVVFIVPILLREAGFPRANLPQQSSPT